MWRKWCSELASPKGGAKAENPDVGSKHGVSVKVVASERNFLLSGLKFYVLELFCSTLWLLKPGSKNINAQLTEHFLGAESKSILTHKFSAVRHAYSHKTASEYILLLEVQEYVRPKPAGRLNYQGIPCESGLDIQVKCTSKTRARHRLTEKSLIIGSQWW